MATPFIGEVKMIGWNFAPKGWALCNGQLLPINQNQALFALLGTRFGGDGRTTFALPDLRGRVPIHRGSGWTVGQKAGETTHTLITDEMPAHNHLVNADTTAGVASPTPQSRPAASSGQPLYGGASNLVSMVPGSISNAGGGQPHENRQPYLTVNFCIALAGIFPSRS